MIPERAARLRQVRIVMIIRAITIEREFGCGGSEIAVKLAELLGWKLWDHELTQEIARLTKSSPEVVERIEWKRDPAVYRVFLSFLRGAFEGGLPPTNRLALLDARRIATVSQAAINQALSTGPCVIVGRGSQYFLRDRKDVFRTFLYASRDYKIHRLVCAGTPERDAIEQVDTTDRDRAAFVKRYLKLNWPERQIYNAMFNTEMGDSYVAEMLAHCAQRAPGQS
jgi:Cytidylate kinase-like family